MEPDDRDALRALARELLDAEADHRRGPTTEATARLGRARRRLEEVLDVDVDTPR